MNENNSSNGNACEMKRFCETVQNIKYLQFYGDFCKSINQHDWLSNLADK